METLKNSINNKSIFGEYRCDENRVTAALLHILNLGGQQVVERLFADKFDLPSNEVFVATQPKEFQSTPDGLISCDCKYQIYIESKIVPNSIREDQLHNHLRLSSPSENKYLIYLTPDMQCPQLLTNFMVDWMDWQTVIDKLLGVIADGLTDAVLSYLIKQFILLIRHLVYKQKDAVNNLNNITDLTNENLEERVIIVGGHWGEEVAEKYKFYACQPYRHFLSARYIAFYHNNRIKFLFKIIDSPEEAVDIQTKVDPSYFAAKETTYIPQLRKFFKLELYHIFDPEIVNDKTDKNGKPCAFIQGQTYTTLSKIMIAKVTSNL